MYIPMTPNGSDFGLESFAGFFEDWLRNQDHDLRELITAANNSTESTQSLRQLINRVLSHYEHYYRVKSESARHNVLFMLTPSWLSTLEGAFLWIGGWRPTAAFHLLYSKAGLQLEAGLAGLLAGFSAGDLGDLTASQLARVDSLQSKTVAEERALTETMAAHQETVADSSMVELSHVLTELIRSPDPESRARARAGPGSWAESSEERVESSLGRKEEGLEAILRKADNLRLRTLRNLVGILSPIQAVHFLIAAAELQLRVHEWGKKKDDRATGPNGPGPATGPGCSNS